MLYELKLKDIEKHLVTCEQLLQLQKRKGFLHHIMTSNEKWIHYNNFKIVGKTQSYSNSGGKTKYP